MKVAIVTLGCKTNQFESAALEQQLRQAGYSLVAFEEGAELVLVNTCTVTARTDAQSRKLIRRARRLNPAARVVVTGCYAQIDPQALAQMPGVTLVLGNEEKRNLLPLLAQAGAAGGTIRVADIRRAEKAEPLLLHHFAERSRAFVQIQNGCDAFCSYCIIPHARGPSRSVAPEAVLDQVRQLVAVGYRELVLTGIHIGGYGRDLSPPLDLAGLVRRLLAETGVPRLRLGSIEPNELHDDLLALLAAEPVLCPHLHIPLQSGCDSVLQRMNRHYDGQSFAALIEKAVDLLPDVAIGLDVITGFPGETAAEFAATENLIERLPVAFLHVFPFSRRPGTPADTMAGQVSPSLVRERAARLRAMGERKAEAFARRFLGETLELVMIGRGVGLTRHYLEAQVAGKVPLEGQFATVQVVGVEGARLLAEVLP